MYRATITQHLLCKNKPTGRYGLMVYEGDMLCISLAIECVLNVVIARGRESARRKRANYKEDK